MHHHAPDDDHGPNANAQEAFQFLALGAGIVLVLRLLVMALGLWSDNGSGELEQAMAPFRNGYPLIGRDVVVLGGLAIIPRIAVGLLFVLLCGVLSALFIWPLGRLLGWNGLRSAVIGSRAGLLLGGAWAIYCLLCLPPRQTRITSTEVERTDRTAFLSTIPLPFAGHSTHWSKDEIDGYGAEQADQGKDASGHRVVMHARGAVVPIAWHMDPDGDRDGVDMRQRAEAKRLANALGTTLR